jgi:hypothetical protein
MKTNIVLKDLTIEHIVNMIELYKQTNPPSGNPKIRDYENIDAIKKNLESVPYHVEILPYNGAGTKIVLSSRMSPNVLNKPIHLDLIPSDDRFLENVKRANQLFKQNYSI